MQNTDDPFIEDSVASFDKCVRENPTRAVLAAVGIGIAVGLLARVLQPKQQPRSHVKQLLEDIRDRLQDLSDPALSRLGDLVDEGSAAIKKGASGMDGMSRRLRSFGDKVEGLFH